MLSATPEEARASCSNGQAGVDRATGKYRPFDRSCDSRKRREREKEERHAVRKLLVDTSPKPASPAALGMHESWTAQSAWERDGREDRATEGDSGRRQGRQCDIQSGG